MTTTTTIRGWKFFRVVALTKLMQYMHSAPRISGAMEERLALYATIRMMCNSINPREEDHHPEILRLLKYSLPITEDENDPSRVDLRSPWKRIPRSELGLEDPQPISSWAHRPQGAFFTREIVLDEKITTHPRFIADTDPRRILEERDWPYLLGYSLRELQRMFQSTADNRAMQAARHPDSSLVQREKISRFHTAPIMDTENLAVDTDLGPNYSNIIYQRAYDEGLDLPQSDQIERVEPMPLKQWIPHLIKTFAKEIWTQLPEYRNSGKSKGRNRESGSHVREYNLKMGEDPFQYLDNDDLGEIFHTIRIGHSAERWEHNLWTIFPELRSIPNPDKGRWRSYSFRREYIAFMRNEGMVSKVRMTVRSAILARINARFHWVPAAGPERLWSGRPRDISRKHQDYRLVPPEASSAQGSVLGIHENPNFRGRLRYSRETRDKAQKRRAHQHVESEIEQQDEGRGEPHGGIRGDRHDSRSRSRSRSHSHHHNSRSPHRSRSHHRSHTHHRSRSRSRSHRHSHHRSRSHSRSPLLYNSERRERQGTLQTMSDGQFERHHGPILNKQALKRKRHDPAPPKIEDPFNNNNPNNFLASSHVASSSRDRRFRAGTPVVIDLTTSSDEEGPSEMHVYQFLKKSRR